MSLREGNRQSVFENRVLKKYMEQRRMKLYEIGDNCIMRNFRTSNLVQA
jgi:hypothetical protein